MGAGRILVVGAGDAVAPAAVTEPEPDLDTEAHGDADADAAAATPLSSRDRVIAAIVASIVPESLLALAKSGLGECGAKGGRKEVREVGVPANVTGGVELLCCR